MRVLTPQDSAYESVRHVYSRRGSPASVYLPTSTAEVAEALSTVRANGHALAIRSGGHGISSSATNDGGDVIDLRDLDLIEPLGDRAVRVGPGARWGTVARSLEPLGLAISSGDSGDVGVGGLATTGGIGLLGRAHGLTIDHLRRAEIVTADGSRLIVSDDEEPDLFWAVRGAGANVGIVTSFEFDAAEVGQVIQLVAAYRPAEVASFLERWGTLVESAPRAVSAFLYLTGGPSPMAQATIVAANPDVDSVGPALERFLRLPGLVGQRAGLVPYASVPVTGGQVHSGAQRAATHSGLANHLDESLSRRLTSLLAGGADMVQIRSVGGAINDIPSSSTAYAHRHQNFSITAVSVHGGSSFDAAWAPVRARADGLYLSFESNHDPQHVLEAFPPSTLERLRAIKTKWDPDDVFSQNFDVSNTADRPTATSR